MYGKTFIQGFLLLRAERTLSFQLEFDNGAANLKVKYDFTEISFRCFDAAVWTSSSMIILSKFENYKTVKKLEQAIG